jgi:hypothetical protein
MDSHDLGKLVDIWILGRVARGEIARTTCETDRWALLGFAKSVRDRDLAAITRTDVQAWVDAEEGLERAKRVD